jgi:hypothetical protein
MTEGDADAELVLGKCTFQALFPPIHIYICYCYMTTLLLLFANAVRQKVVRKKTIGLGLERLIKRGNKMPIQVAEGKKRPDVPLQAAKLASEIGVALRDQLPIYTSWKQYQKEAGPAEVQKVLDKVAVRQLFHSAYFLELVWFPGTKLCLINHLWMQTRLDVEVERADQRKLHALISLRREYDSRGTTLKGSTSTHH